MNLCGKGACGTAKALVFRKIQLIFTENTREGGDLGFKKGIAPPFGRMDQVKSLENAKSAAD